MEELIINRKKWLHGEGATNSRLLRISDGKMCCLGFYALSQGLKKSDISGVDNPGYLAFNKNKKLPKLITRYNRNKPTCQTLMIINDDESTSDEVREKKIISLFKRIKVAVVFKGKY